MSTAKLEKRTVAELVEDIKSLTTEIQELYCLDAIPWIIGYSGGKDSSAVVQLIWNAVAALPPEKRNKKIYVLTTDTLVENPIVVGWVKQSLDRLKTAAQKQDLPFEPHLLQPVTQDTFWVNLIGKGYPAPRHMFRWCTERLKIKPSNRFVQEVVASHGEVIIVLGTRKAESIKRAGVMDGYEIGSVSDRLNSTQKLKGSLLYNGTMPNSLIYSPIADWRDDEVWLYLMQYKNPWGQSNQDLFVMYRGATEDNECPFVIDTSTPSCGDSRFGCWVCTLVNADKSMEAMIQNDEEKEWMQPLLDLRNQLDVYDDHDRRDFRRLTGRVQLFERNTGKNSTEIVPIPGPYTKHWREEWLRQVLTAQNLARQNAPAHLRDITLISLEELGEIRRIWREEKHEFDDALPRIYRQITGKIFPDPHPVADSPSHLGPDEWQLLQELCSDDPMHLELVTKLLHTEHQYQRLSRRSGILKDLEKCFGTSARSKDDAIAAAHRDRDLKQAAEQGDIEAIRQIVETPTLPKATESPATYSASPATLPDATSWAKLKYGQRNSSTT
jgi:DNA sulfur modification protein DndC